MLNSQKTFDRRNFLISSLFQHAFTFLESFMKTWSETQGKKFLTKRFLKITFERKLSSVVKTSASVLMSQNPFQIWNLIDLRCLLIFFIFNHEHKHETCFCCGVQIERKSHLYKNRKTSFLKSSSLKLLTIVCYVKSVILAALKRQIKKVFKKILSLRSTIQQI